MQGTFQQPCIRHVCHSAKLREAPAAEALLACRSSAVSHGTCEASYCSWGFSLGAIAWLCVPPQWQQAESLLTAPPLEQQEGSAGLFADSSHARQALQRSCVACCCGAE